MAALLHSVSPWAIVGAYALFWFAVSAFVRSMLRRWLVEAAPSQRTELSELLVASVPRAAAIAVFLVAMSAGLRWVPLPAIVSKEVTRYFPVGLGILGIGVIMRIAFRAIDAYGRSNPDLKSTAGLGRAAMWIVGVASMALYVSEALQISLAPALTALGVGSLAVALALQDSLSNFFAGVHLLADKPIRPKDFIRFDVNEGYVEAIGWRSTQLRTLSNNLIVVPNATLAKAVITNFSRPTPHLTVEVRIDVSNEADPDAVEKILVEEAERAVDIAGIVADAPPVVRFTQGPGDGAFGFTIFLQAEDIGAQGLIQHTLRKRVVARLRVAKTPLPATRASLR